MPIRVETPAGIAEFPDGMSPAEIELALSEQFSVGTPEPVASHGPAEAKRNLLQEQIGFAERGETMPIVAPLQVVGQAAGPIAQAIGKLAPKFMRNAMGAQQGIRNKFSQVDLDDVALREGAIPGDRASIKRIGDMARSAGKDIGATANRLDAAGAAPITARQISKSLRPMFDEAKAAQRPDIQQKVVERVRQIRKEVGPGLSLSGTQARKQFLQQEAKSALGAANPRDAAITSQLANSERGALTEALRSHPQMADALTRSQEFMALSRAMQQTGNRTSLLRDIMGASGGATAGAAVGAIGGGPLGALVGAPVGAAATTAITRAATSPQLLGRAAGLMSRTGQEGTPRLQQSLRSLLLEMIAANQPGEPR